MTESPPVCGLILRLVGVKALTFATAVCGALALAPAVQAGIATYPSSQTIQASGPLPPGGGSKIQLNTARYELEDGVIVVSGATKVSATVDASRLAPLTVQLLWGHFVLFGAKPIPDALMPWDGTERDTEKPNQPIWVQVTVPPDANPGTYTGTVTVTADGKSTPVPFTVRVFPVTLPAPGTATGNLLSSIHVSAETYLNTASTLYGFHGADPFLGQNKELYAFMSRYRLSPYSWGYGNPKSPSGYTTSPKWWRDAAENMAAELDASEGFPSMWIPISNNRWLPGTYLGGLSPYEPETWCDYLGSVRSFWVDHGWLSSSVPFVYGMDEPALSGQRVVARQAAVVHRCFPEAKVLMTGNPSPTGKNNFLLSGDGRLDIWAVLSDRYYGEFTVPVQQKLGKSREREKYFAIQKARASGAMIWTYTYGGTRAPSFLATEPLSDPRILLLWTALEDNQGLLYSDPITAYKGNPYASVPLGGALNLLYPGPYGPEPSARLEQIRDGFEDWAIFNLVRHKHGQATVRQILGGNGLFSATRAGVELACVVGCEIKGPSPDAWPVWSQDATTPRKIEAAQLAALQAAS